MVKKIHTNTSSMCVKIAIDNHPPPPPPLKKHTQTPKYDKQTKENNNDAFVYFLAARL